MRVTAKIDMCCPSGFYCEKVGNPNKCCRLNHTEYNKPYCEVFYPFVETDSAGNVLKCEQCLLAEREARLKR